MNIDQQEIFDPYLYPYSGTFATKMLAEAFKERARNAGLSQRQIAAKLHYRTSVTLSHMAIGRIPIPINRAPELARILGLDAAEFLLAVMEQRHPEIDFRRILRLN